MRVVDTNTGIYHLGGRLIEPLGDEEYSASVITEIELLSYPSLSQMEEERAVAFLSSVTIVGLTPDIRDAAIRLRRDHRLKLPDAIIAATALVLDAELLTNDARLLRVPELRTRQMRLRDS